ncbi:MAG: Fe-S cluster assembly protein SufD, partial [Candidatus Thermoplasmatota archaeon]|nr:Fe-S cluster assembly protein SufD [Candidatus Thermoplasmatota archaeon]
TVAQGEPVTVSHPRLVIRAGESSEAAVLESYGAIGDGVSFTNAVTEIVADKNATLRHYKLELESENAFHMASQQVHQSRDSSVRTHNICLGGKLTRNDLNAELVEENAECLMNGLFALHGDQHCDNHTLIDHIAPNCESHQLYKGILDGQSRGVFLGRIFVDPEAQRTNADQHNPNLLLSKEALVNTTPQLEIFADDVRCTHGSTFGQLDEEGIFYMRTRGIDHATARAVLTYAFAAEVTETIQLEPVRERVNDLVLSRLPKGDMAREALE